VLRRSGKPEECGLSPFEREALPCRKVGGKEKKGVLRNLKLPSCRNKEK